MGGSAGNEKYEQAVQGSTSNVQGLCNQTGLGPWAWDLGLPSKQGGEVALFPPQKAIRFWGEDSYFLTTQKTDALNPSGNFKHSQSVKSRLWMSPPLRQRKMRWFKCHGSEVRRWDAQE